MGADAAPPGRAGWAGLQQRAASALQRLGKGRPKTSHDRPTAAPAPGPALSLRRYVFLAANSTWKTDSDKEK